MFTSDFPLLRSDRLLLRELTQEDAFDLVEIIGFNVPDPNVSKAIAKVQETKAIYQKQEGITWGIIYDNELVGTVGYYRGFAKQTGEIGYVMKHNFKRLGIMSEACGLALRYGFKSLKLSKVTAFTPIENTPSVNMLLGLGFNNSFKKKDQFTIFEISKANFNR